MSDVTIYSISASWDPAAKEGRLANADGSFAIRHAGAPPLGARAGAPSPEELLLSGIAACFVQTWAIFLEKLKVPVSAPRLDSTAQLEKDPAGGYRITRIDLVVHVPAALLSERQADVEKTLALSEKYCIVSKAVKASVPVTVSSKAV